MNTKNRELHLSPGQIAWKRFKKHKLAMYSFWVIIILALLSIIIPNLTGKNVEDSNVRKIYEAPSSEHILGTDRNGRDVFTRLFYGGRISLAVGITAALCSALIGTIIGSIAGYFGGAVDSSLMRLTDTMLSLPVLPLLIILSVVDFEKIGLGFFKTTEIGGVLKIVLIIAVFSWMGVARLVRGEVLSLKNREFIDAAKVLGADNSRIILKHLIPNSLTPVIISTTLSLGSIIQYEAVLSFLSLGLPESTPSWGNMLSDAIENMNKVPMLFIYPGLLISATVICINFIGDGLRDALDPRQILNK